MNLHADAGASGRRSHSDHGESHRYDLRDHCPGRHGPHRYDDDPGHRKADYFDPHHAWDRHPHHHDPAPAPQASDGMIAVLGGSAAAAGDDTAAIGFIENFAEDRGGYSIATGEAIFEASAHSAERGGAAAAADTFLSVSGADFIFEREIDHAMRGPHDATARSELEYLSIDIHDWSPPHGPIVIEMGHMGLCFGQHLSIDQGYGNVAMTLATAEAHGVDSLAATLTTAFTVENRFSFVTATGIVAV
jgi:hypothetical protein